MGLTIRKNCDTKRLTQFNKKKVQKRNFLLRQCGWVLDDTIQTFAFDIVNLDSASAITQNSKDIILFSVQNSKVKTYRDSFETPNHPEMTPR